MNPSTTTGVERTSTTTLMNRIERILIIILRILTIVWHRSRSRCCGGGSGITGTGTTTGRSDTILFYTNKYIYIEYSVAVGYVMLGTNRERERERKIVYIYIYCNKHPTSTTSGSNLSRKIAPVLKNVIRDSKDGVPKIPSRSSMSDRCVLVPVRQRRDPPRTRTPTHTHKSWTDTDDDPYSIYRVCWSIQYTINNNNNNNKTIYLSI